MAVAFDASATVMRTLTTSPQTWTHTPSGTPRCIIVFVIHGTSSTDHVTAMTYGGVAMSKRTSQADTTGEPGRCDLWILSQAYENAASIPTGAQTVSATCGATTDDIWFVSMSFTGNGPVTIVNGVNALIADTANPSQAFDSLRCANLTTILCIGGMYSGLDTTAAAAPQSGNTTVANVQFAGATFTGAVVRQTTPGTGAFTAGWTAVSDDVAAIFAMLSEAVDLPSSKNPTIVMPQLLAI